MNRLALFALVAIVLLALVSVTVMACPQQCVATNSIPNLTANVACCSDATNGAICGIRGSPVNSLTNSFPIGEMQLQGSQNFAGSVLFRKGTIFRSDQRPVGYVPTTTAEIDYAEVVQLRQVPAAVTRNGATLLKHRSMIPNST